MSSEPLFVLVPGFFGFVQLGNLRYFAGVEDAMARAMERRGVTGDIVVAEPSPTGSIRQRAQAIWRLIEESRAGGDIHMIGHSTGGLDARVALALGPDERPVDQATVERVASLVTVSTPHLGTPLADYATRVMGSPALSRLAKLAAFLVGRRRRLVDFGLAMGGWWTRMDDVFGQRDTVLDEIYRDLLSELSPDVRERLKLFLTNVAEDQSLLFQLTAAGCDLINATVSTPKHIRHGSVITRSPKPTPQGLRGTGSLYGVALFVAYGLAYALAARSREGKIAERAIDADIVDPPLERRDNDGIVPSLSQVWGEIIAVVEADHLDVVGHHRRDVGADWLPSGSQFDGDDFDQLWDRVVAFGLEREAASLPTRQPSCMTAAE